ncbi:unnamed protein product, partial [Pleuronectes platessa]
TSTLHLSTPLLIFLAPHPHQLPQDPPPPSSHLSCDKSSTSTDLCTRDRHSQDFDSKAELSPAWIETSHHEEPLSQRQQTERDQRRFTSHRGRRAAKWNGEGDLKLGLFMMRMMMMMMERLCDATGRGLMPISIPSPPPGTPTNFNGLVGRMVGPGPFGSGVCMPPPQCFLTPSILPQSKHIERQLLSLFGSESVSGRGIDSRGDREREEEEE